MLKKKIVCALLAAALITATAVPAISLEGGAYAATVATEKTPAATSVAISTKATAVATGAATTTNAAVTSDAGITTDGALASPTGNIIPLEAKKSLSLEQALKIMITTGTRAEAAALNKKADSAMASGYSEQSKTIQKALDQMDATNSVSAIDVFKDFASKGIMLDPTSNTNMALAGTVAQMTNQTIRSTILAAQNAGATSINKKIVEKRRDFARSYTDTNYNADINKIEQDTINVYSQVLLAESNYKIAQDNLTAQQKNLKNVNSKKAVGLLSKKDVLQAQSAVMDAESQARAAKTTMDYAHMSFNYLLGYNVMQEVTFTDKLVATTDQIAPVESAVTAALKNRNEIAGADFAVEVYKMLFNDVKAYPKNSATYMTAQYNLLNAQQTAKNARSQIEIDIRNQAALLADKKAALEAAKSLQAYASEGVRLMTLTNEEGLSTVEELLATQVSLYKANLNLAKATSDYNLAVRSYQDAQGIGTMRIPL